MYGQKVSREVVDSSVSTCSQSYFQRGAEDQMLKAAEGDVTSGLDGDAT
jgi:hypothetical protein